MHADSLGVGGNRRLAVEFKNPPIRLVILRRDQPARQYPKTLGLEDLHQH